MHARFEVRPPFLCRLLFSASAFRCRCRDGWLLLDTKGGEKAIRMEAVTETHWRELSLVGPLALKTAEAGPRRPAHSCFGSTSLASACPLRRDGPAPPRALAGRGASAPARPFPAVGARRGTSGRRADGEAYS
jgi:hypothetical protein